MSSIISGIRKRFLEEFNRARLVKGDTMQKKILAEKIGMTPAQVTRLEYKENFSIPSHEQIFLLCKNHGADLSFIYFGERSSVIKQSDLKTLVKRIERLEKAAGIGQNR